MSYDLCTWTKNGEKTLAQVLQRIDDIVPCEEINQKILVDDHSTDRTVEIAQDFNWTVYENPSTGISAGANEALRHVEAKRFGSFEQDCLLNREWFEKVPPLLAGKHVVVASGIRNITEPKGLKTLYQKRVDKLIENRELRNKTFWNMGMTLDNTVYRTNIMKSVGFPKQTLNAGVDTALAYSLKQKGLCWKVDYTVQSEHLRFGLRDVLQRAKYYAMLPKPKKRIGKRRFTFKHYLTRLFFGVPIGLLHSLKLCEPTLFYEYPLEILFRTDGFFKGRLQK